MPDSADLAEPAAPIVGEVGEGANQANAFWICAWMGEWLRTRDRQPHAAASAWRRVKRADKTQLHRKHYYDPRDVWHHEILQPAHAGNPATFREFYTTSCTYPSLAAVPRG